MDERTLLELLRKIIYKETIYLRHYYGKVVSISDELKEGRVRVACDQLGMNKGEELWASPRGKAEMTTPKVGDWVEIYFMNGDRDRCVYLGKCLDMENMLPKNYDGKPTTQILFEDPQNKCNIKYDGLIDILTFFKGTKSFVLGEDLISAFNSHTHAVPPLGTSGTPSVPVTASILSTKIKGE